jgi:hypothetical protein
MKREFILLVAVVTLALSSCSKSNWSDSHEMKTDTTGQCYIHINDSTRITSELTVVGYEYTVVVMIGGKKHESTHTYHDTHVNLDGKYEMLWYLQRKHEAYMEKLPVTDEVFYGHCK